MTTGGCGTNVVVVVVVIVVVVVATTTRSRVGRVSEYYSSILFGGASPGRDMLVIAIIGDLLRVLNGISKAAGERVSSVPLNAL